MKIKILATGKVEEKDAAYAVRMIEQGRAVPVKEPEKTAKAKK